MFTGKSYPLFKLRNIPVKVDASWFLIFVLLVYSLAVHFFPERYPETGAIEAWILAIVATIFLFASVLAHEFAHAIVALNHGLKTRRIVLFIFGGVAQMEDEPRNARSEFLIAGAGPLCSFFIGLFFLIIAAPLEDVINPGIYGVIWYIGIINMVLAGFNLIPGFPLDGGRMLRAAIWKFTGNLRKSTRIVSLIGQAFSLFLVFSGVLWLLSGFILQGLLWIFVGIFLLQSARNSYQMVALREGLSNIPVKKVMTFNPVCIPKGYTIQRAVDDFFLNHAYAGYPVWDENLTILGIIELKEVRSTDKKLWSSTKVEDVMKPLDQLPVVEPDSDVLLVLNAMIKHGVGRMIVQKNKSLAGIISRKDILNYMDIHDKINS